jgi:hypothetical protein
MANGSKRRIRSEVRSPKPWGANDDYTNPEMQVMQLVDNALNLVKKVETSVNAKLA